MIQFYPQNSPPSFVELMKNRMLVSFSVTYGKVAEAYPRIKSRNAVSSISERILKYAEMGPMTAMAVDVANWP